MKRFLEHLLTGIFAVAVSAAGSFLPGALLVALASTMGWRLSLWLCSGITFVGFWIVVVYQVGQEMRLGTEQSPGVAGESYREAQGAQSPEAEAVGGSGALLQPGVTGADQEPGAGRIVQGE